MPRGCLVKEGKCFEGIIIFDVGQQIILSHNRAIANILSVVVLTTGMINKRIWSDFLKTLYHSKYWPKKKSGTFKCLEISFGKIEPLRFLKSFYDIFLDHCGIFLDYFCQYWKCPINLIFAINLLVHFQILDIENTFRSLLHKKIL